MEFSWRPHRIIRSSCGGRIAVRHAVVPGRLLVPELILASGDRILVEGANGSGKTTLIELLAGELVPTSGEVVAGGRISHLRQSVHALDPELTTLTAFAAGLPGGAEEHADLLLSLGLVDEEHLDREVGRLSIGQQRRIEIARLVSTPVDIVLLDEPTNHVAPELVEQLEEAMMQFGGTVVLASHDRLLRRRWSGSVVQIEEGLLGVPDSSRKART